MEPSSYTSIALYNIGAIIMERSASLGVSAVEERKAETFLEKAAQHWSHQQLNTSARVLPRIYNRLISLYLKSSPKDAPDLNLAVSQDNLTHAGAIITRYHRLFSRCSNWMKSTFYLGKTDYCIRSRNIDGGKSQLSVSQYVRNLSVIQAKTYRDSGLWVFYYTDVSVLLAQLLLFLRLLLLTGVERSTTTWLESAHILKYHIMI